jgi:drug/metabolite transporter (DMT)-like permease
MVVSTLFLISNDATLKWVSTDLPVGQMLFTRGCVTLAIVAFFAWRAGGLRALRVVHPRAQAARAGLVVLGTFLFINALRLMPLADAVSLGSVGPILISAMAPFVLREPVGWRRWSAILVGFLGVVVMLRPTGEGLYWAALLPVAAASTGALRDIITRRIIRAESSIATLFYTTVAVTAGGLATAPFGWQAPHAGDLGLLFMTGIMLYGAHFLQIEAYRHGEAATIAPFRYTALVWATLFGFLLWGDVPDSWTVTGATLVVISGLYIFHRETVRGRLR